MKLKIISGGQYGADMGGLCAARANGIETGGCAAKGFKTEDGDNTNLASVYNLIDKGFDYARRTEENVLRSDITLVFADKLDSPGTKKTIELCKIIGRPCIVNPPAFAVRDIIRPMQEILSEESTFTINVAGNRESVAPGIQKRTTNVLNSAFKMVKFLEV